MQSQTLHPTSPPSDESLASTAGPRSIALPAPISSVSSHARPRWQAGPINMISSGAPPQQVASHTYAQQSHLFPPSARPTADVASSTQTEAGSSTPHPHRQDSASKTAAAPAASPAALPIQPANGKYGRRGRNTSEAAEKAKAGTCSGICKGTCVSSCCCCCSRQHSPTRSGSNDSSL